MDRKLELTPQPNWSKRHFIPVICSMSTLLRVSLVIAVACGSIVAQDLDVHITIDEAKPGVAMIEGRYTKPGGVPGLGITSCFNSISGVKHG